MEYWLENQGQSQLYSRFGTLSGRNCAHNYHSRHQATYNTLYYGEQQNKGREPSDWTVSGSRPGGALQECANWAEAELPNSSSPNFPFILHHHDQRNQDRRDYRPHNPRDREWASHSTVGNYERGFLRDAWPKRWDQNHPSHHRDVSAKRNDNSYRELEAWAARYSHSLPRRRRLEAELREGAQGMLDSSRDPEREKLVTNPRVQPQHGQLNLNCRASGLWGNTEPPGMLTNHVKEKIPYQSRLFCKPPGYMGPPPYNRPHKNPLVVHHRNDGWQQVGKEEASWSQPPLTKQDVPVDCQTKRKVEKGESKTWPELEEVKYNKDEEKALEAASPNDEQMPEGDLAKEGKVVKNSDIENEDIYKVIEGRKFSLKKKTGGMTIFCLVSRIASPSETSLPVCTSQTSFQITETGDLSKGRQENNQVNKLADEMDFRAETLKEESDKKTLRCPEKVMPEDDLHNTANSVFLEKSGFERSVPQSVLPVFTKYPLWKEPSSTSMAESESSNTNRMKWPEESILSQNEGGQSSMDNEKQKPQITNNAEDMKGLVVIDTSCVVVKMELIPSPKKEQVHFLGSTANNESGSSESDSQLYQDVMTDPSNEALRRNGDPEANLDPTLLEKQEQNQSAIFPSGVQPCFLSERETLEERAERILGIALHDSFTKQQTENEQALTEWSLDVQNEEPEPSPSEETVEDTPDHVNAFLAEKDKDDIRKQPRNEDSKDLTESQQKATDMAEINASESQLTTSRSLMQTELKKDNRDESTCGECKKEEPLIEINNSSSLYLNLSESSTQEGLDSHLDAQSSDIRPTPNPDTSLPPMKPPTVFPESPDSLLSHPLSDDHFPSPPPADIIFLAGDMESGAETKDDESEILHSPESGVKVDSFVTEMKEYLPHRLGECHQLDNVPCVAEDQQIDEADSSGAETKLEDLNILAKQLTFAYTEVVPSEKEVKDPQVAEENICDSTVQINENNGKNSRSIEMEHSHFLPNCDLEEDILCRKERDSAPEQSQISPGLTSSVLEQTQSNDSNTCTQTQQKADSLENPGLQDELNSTFPSSSSGAVLNNLVISDFSSPPQEADRDYETYPTGSPRTVDIAASLDIVENTYKSFCLDSSEESTQQLTFLAQEKDVSSKVSPSAAPKHGSQYPKSLFDIVNRIRKHTAPDSESEEEEVSEQWDPSSLDVVVLDIKSGENFSDELQVVFKDSAETERVDQEDKAPEGNSDVDNLSSEDPVIVSGAETRLSGGVGREEESDTAEGDQSCSSEEKDETKSKEIGEDEEEEQNICVSGEKSLVEIDQDSSDLLN